MKKFISFFCIRTVEKTIADSLPIENLSENPGPREIIKVYNAVFEISTVLVLM